MRKRHEVLAFFVWVAVIILFALAAVTVHGEEIYPQKDWVWGCKIHGRTLDGICAVRLFTKTGETENNLDTDEPMVVGFSPGNVVLNKKGEPVWERIPDKLFLKKGENKLMSGARCSCK